MLLGGIVGSICMFVPEAQFRGEAQLQSILDRSETPLPITGGVGGMNAYQLCSGVVDGQAGKRSTTSACALLFAAAKTLAVSVSLGTNLP